MVRNIYYITFLIKYVYSSRYDIYRKPRAYIDGEEDYWYENTQGYQSLQEPKEISLSILFRSPTRETHTTSHLRNESFDDQYMYANRHEYRPQQLFFPPYGEHTYKTSRTHFRFEETFEYEESSRRKQRNRYLPYYREEKKHRNPGSDFEEMRFRASRDNSFDYKLKEELNERYESYNPRNLDERYHTERSDIYIENGLHNTEQKSKFCNPIYENSNIKDEDYVESYNCTEFRDKNGLKIEKQDFCSTMELYLSKIKTSSKIIDTHGKNYAILENLVTEYIGFSDIQFFIEGDFSIDGYVLKADNALFFELIDHIAANENGFWSQIDSDAMIKYLAEKLKESVERYDFCKPCSPLLSYAKNIVNLKYFIKSIIKEDINLVKNSCLWILLLKTAESLCNVQPNKIVCDKNIIGEVLSKEHKDFDMYNGDKNAFLVLKRLYMVYDKIARKIFRMTKIPENYIYMLDFIFINVIYRNKDIHISQGGYIYLSRVISDCIFQMNPKIIIFFISQLKNLGISKLKKFDSVYLINNLLITLYKNPHKVDSKIRLNFRLMYENMIDSYIELFENEFCGLIILRDKESLVKNELKHIDLIVQKHKNKKIFLERLDLKDLIDVAQDICVMLNHFIKVGLNNEFYSQKYIQKSTKDCNKRLKAIFKILEIYPD
ncbi:hypothetical protein CWI36_0023p0070 [Hamiltosporidium magnivora]|uniref:Uncharacterized protein n=1 Tax=Hamiltosporidium magnivora TaxID=148818 RepID=A0A4V2JWW4_9MICR|nr:hypothetical protein CWI36_0023p0070 [Hamiltosporidium magnivora]